ncbi:MAG: chloramphenicol acetyltransferase [Erysipelotrichaceae bacterium]|nr:chloramphenicol acetyltransferase [Erysipelotrichaceae bacterium]MDY5251948.1 CatA-like O-acetyltransferase [Erysipelotrichaceae bacterium]
MTFKQINLQTWERKERYEHFMHEVICSYATTVELDITNLKGLRLYPTLLYLLTKSVNDLVQFRTSLFNDQPIIFDQMHPAYTIFNKETKQFSNIWTSFSNDYQTFVNSYENDVVRYQDCTSFSPKPDRPFNTFDVSMIPWLNFTSFNLQVINDGKYLLPIFTIGKYQDIGNKRIIPLAIQVHHAVCDGYHVAAFVNTLQEYIDNFPSN